MTEQTKKTIMYPRPIHWIYISGTKHEGKGSGTTTNLLFYALKTLSPSSEPKKTTTGQNTLLHCHWDSYASQIAVQITPYTIIPFTSSKT